MVGAVAVAAASTREVVVLLLVTQNVLASWSMIILFILLTYHQGC